MNSVQNTSRAVHELLARYLEAWNARDPAALAAGLVEEALIVGFDGSVMEGREAARATIATIFSQYATGRYVWLPRRVRELGPGLAVISAMAGLVPAGQADVDPRLNAVQTLVAVHRAGEWRIAVFQNTPAQFHGRPEAAESLTAELRAELRRRRGVREGT